MIGWRTVQLREWGQTEVADVFDERRLDSERRIDELRTFLGTELDKLPPSEDHPSLTIYATGSLARREVTTHSDLDAFFMLSGAEDRLPLGRIRDVKTLNTVLEAADAGGFPDFSNDGEYLKFLHIEDVVCGIGSRHDDYKNNFTARMLMMLESCCLYHEENFATFQRSVFQAYFEDFHDHSEEFRPVFLLNDVLRFWRTLCLNYENSRHWRGEADPSKSARGHLNNLKLKFSRMNICFSFISHLLNQGPHLSIDNAISTARLSPIDRLRAVRDDDGSLGEVIERMLREYEWFLVATDRKKDQMLSWMTIESNRKEAFDHAANFVKSTGELVRAVAEKHGYLRYLIV